MNHNTIFTDLFTLFIALFTVSACDNGGGENNNQTVDQDVKDWCVTWLYCSESPGAYPDIPWNTQEECEEIVQYIKKHQDDNEEFGSCHYTLMRASIVSCSSINLEWGMESGWCKYTPYGYCPDGPDEPCP